MRQFLKIIMAVGCLLYSGSVLAQTKVITAGGYFDAERGRIVSPANIVVNGGQIAAVNPSSLPEGAEVIDLGSMTLVPGLMDAHTHLNFDVDDGFLDAPVREKPGDFALRGAKNAKATLMAGFTTVRDMGSTGFTDVSLMHAIDRGWIAGPRMIPAGHAISITGGHCDTTGFNPGILEGDHTVGLADGVDEVLKAVRYQIKHGAKVIKVCATAGVLSFEGPVGAQQMTFEELKAAADEAHRHGIKVAAHAHGTEGIIAASEAGIDSIEHNSVMTDEAARILKKNGTWLVSTLYLAQGIPLDQLPSAIRIKAETVLPLADRSFTSSVEKELKIAFGTDAAVYPHGDNAREFAVRVGLGQSPLEALKSATIYTAELFGTPDRGDIKEGLLADIIAVEGNPLEDISVLEDVKFVMKGGEVYKGGN